MIYPGRISFSGMSAAKNKQGEPWWCMPDPDPDLFTVRSDTTRTTWSEFANCPRRNWPLRSGTSRTGRASRSRCQPLPEPIVTLAPTPTPRPIEGSEPEEILLNAGCTSCHKIGDLGEGHKVGPDLSNIGWLARRPCRRYGSRCLYLAVNHRPQRLFSP